LILANWSLATLDPLDIEAATTSWSHLVDLYQYLKLPFDSFALWKPSQQNLKQLSFQVQYFNAKGIRARILDCLENDITDIDAELIDKRPAPQTIPEATRAWQQAERNTMNQVGSQNAFELLCELHESQRFDPLVAEAMQASDALERNALLTLAETSRLVQPQVLLITEKLRRSIGEKGTRVSNVVSKEEMASVLAQVDRVIALTKGVQACRQHKPTKKALGLKSSEPLSKPSASTPKNSQH
jgi:hypothetical protein